MQRMTLASAAQPTFGRHETFYLRHGWLKKAFDAAAGDPTVFARPDSTVLLGIGKNMVHAMRYWALAFKVLEEKRNPTRPRLSDIVPSAFGLSLLSENGYDPYLELPASLWLLQWQLLRPPCLAPVWWLAFNGYPASVFTDSSMSGYVVEQLASTPGWPSPTTGSIVRDIECLVHMYAQRRISKGSFEDSLNSPFRELGLINDLAGDAASFRFGVGSKVGLPDEIVGFACLDFHARTETQSQTVSVAKLASSPGGPGKVFKLNESAIYDALERLSQSVSSITVAEPAGVKQLYIHRDPAATALRVLERFYGRSGNYRRAADRTDGSLPLDLEGASARGRRALRHPVAR